MAPGRSDPCPAPLEGPSRHNGGRARPNCPREPHPMRKSLLSLAVLALVAAPAFAGKYNKVVSVGDKAPTFAGIPAVDGRQGRHLSLGDIKEDVVVLVFLANHCPVVVAVRGPPQRLRQRLQGQERQARRRQRQRHRRRPPARHQGAGQGEGLELRLRLRREPEDRPRPTARPTPRSSSCSTRTGSSATSARMDDSPERGQGHQDLPARRRRRPAEGRDRRGEPRPARSAAASSTSADRPPDRD